MEPEFVDDLEELLAGRTAFRDDLETLINRHSMENNSNTPDYILADI